MRLRGIKLESLWEERGRARLEGTVVRGLPMARFRVELANGHKVLATISARCGSTTSASFAGPSGRRAFRYDLTRGRIVYRHK